MDGIFSDQETYAPDGAPPPHTLDAVGSPEPQEERPTPSPLKLKISRKRVISDSDEPFVSAGRVTRSAANGEPSAGRSLRSRSGRTGSPDSFGVPQVPRLTRSGRTAAPTYRDDDDDDDDLPLALGKKRTGTSSRPRRTRNDDFIEDDEDDLESDGGYGASRSRTHKPPPSKPKKSPRKRARTGDEDDDFQLTGKSELETDEESGSHDFDAPVTSPSPEPDPSPRRTRAAPHSPRGYTLRPQRRPINYEIPPPLDNDASFAAAAAAAANTNDKPNRPARPRLGFARTLSHALFDNLSTLPAPPPINDDSDSDDPNNQANKAAAASASNVSGGQGLIGAGGATGGDVATAAGGPANYGKVSKDSLLADTDPLGVNVNVTFEQVGGLDDHIASLKEMVTLPLLYPEIFQEFKITPPRGVLFHGPPGTGKTLLARALAASARSGGREVAFFMRKGADILSKWVGEAERQLRLLFEEAKNCQPSIIFFDEIDGLAPVRSSKQDQIHASIVSTLLALMDGMDGRGQVIVIGATNRPDAVDPALRRPGRFDREFYFPLPNLVGRKKILQILTRGWTGWEGETGEPVLNAIADATKGYGGADLRALATEATLNAIQRTYPQIYKSSERLVVQPDTIRVIPRDFMISIKKIVASSARSTASAAAPLPPQITPLLQTTLDRVRATLNNLLPKNKTHNVLEDAEWEDDTGDDGGFHRELQLQAMESQRVYRPRLLIHGAPGMGQSMIGGAALHHLEGVHIQSLDLGTLFGDSTKSVEAALIQLFVEAKRRKPSVIYIPSLGSWSTSLSEAARNTMRELLDSVPSTDAILVLGVLQGDLDDLTPDIRDWFGYAPENSIAVGTPTSQQRLQFFSEILDDVRRPPNQFPDAFPRRRRILPELPIAPPPPPRQATAAEIAALAEKDRQIHVTLTARLGPVLSEMKKRYRRSTRSIEDAKEIAQLHAHPDPPVQVLALPVDQVNGATAPIDVEMLDAQAPPTDPPSVPQNATTNGALTNGVTDPASALVAEAVLEVPIISAPPPVLLTVPTPPSVAPRPIPKVYEIDIDKMQYKLYDKEAGYLTPSDVLNDLGRIVHNTRIEPCNMEHVFKAHQMYSDFEAIIWDPQFLQDCERMAARQRARRSAAKAEAAKLAAPPTETAPIPEFNGHIPPVADGLQSERGLKRQRGDGDSADGGSGAETPEGSLSKRAKLAMPGLSPSQTDQNFGSYHTHFAPSSPQPNVNGFEPEGSATNGNHTSPAAPDNDLAPRASSPILPDFLLSEHEFLNLRSHVEHASSPLSVEQLEELRAILLSCVWQRRADWDRSLMIQDMVHAVSGYLARPNVSKS